jgi:DNA-binding LacI/PurR family transcriptional regulator
VPDRSRSSSSRLTAARPPQCVGLLIDRIAEGYHGPLVRGAIDGARNAGAHLLCFAGGPLGAPPGEGGERNEVFELARPPGVDALVVAAGAIGNRVAPERLEKHCERYRPVPMCSVAVELAGMSSVSIDNESGMRGLVEHVLQVHGARRIAFVGGPQANPESVRRFATYCEALDRAGIALAPERVVWGDFEQTGGREAVRVLLADRKLPVQGLDAIVAANDALALGVIAELAARDVRVPDRMAVVGFDDIEEARYALPPLTTVRQPLYEQGRTAVRMVLRQLRDGAPAEHVVLRTEPVVRRSCGCIGTPLALPTRVHAAVEARASFEVAFLERRQIVLAELTRAGRGQLGTAGSDWCERLLNAFVEQLRGTSPNAFVRAYDDLLLRLTTSQVDLGVCNDLLSALRGAMLGCLHGDPRRSELAENTLHEARVMTAEAMDRSQALRRIRVENRAHALEEAVTAIASARSLEGLARAVSAHFPGFGMPRCYVVQRTDARAASARVVLAHAPEGSGTAAAGWTGPAPLAELLRGLLPTTGEHAFAVLPMMQEGEDLGLLVLELGAGGAEVYELLRDVFTAALAPLRSSLR